MRAYYRNGLWVELRTFTHELTILLVPTWTTVRGQIRLFRRGARAPRPFLGPRRQERGRLTSSRCLPTHSIGELETTSAPRLG